MATHTAPTTRPNRGRGAALLPIGAVVTAITIPWLGVSPVRAVDPTIVPFSFTSAEQQWDVPAGVTSIHVDLIGGRGGGVNGTSAAGGFGGHVVGDLTVAAGQTLFIEVAGNGGNGGLGSGPGGGGFNGGSPGASSSCAIGGGGGGGASDIRTINRGLAGSDASRLIVAGGGGGAANSPASAGGAAGLPGGTPGSNGDAGPGGPGGALSAGGGGAPGTDGSAGSSGTGSTGGFGGQGGSCLDNSATGGGGGGGGGFFGGGGGGGAGFTVFTGTHAPAGGGGGSSSTGAATSASATIDNTGVASVTISYVPGGVGGGGGQDNGTVGAQVTVPSSAACIQISTPTVDFGTLLLGSEDQPATPDITVTNCAALGSDIYASATDASGTNATWALTNTAETCADTLGTDRYRLGLEQAGAETGLGTTNSLLESLASGAAGTHTARIWTACPGSTGSGTTMTMQITFLATSVGG